MIKVVASDESRIVNIRVNGRQFAHEFGAAGQMFAKRFACQQRLRILFDWTTLVEWDDDDAASAACRQWRDAAPLIERAAIIHDHHWNRHAAVVAAILRTNSVDVRSWLVADYRKALAWLNER